MRGRDIIVGCIKRAEVGCGRNGVVEMEMWSCKDRISNKIIIGTTKVGKISKTVQERRLKWY